MKLIIEYDLDQELADDFGHSSQAQFVGLFIETLGGAIRNYSDRDMRKPGSEDGKVFFAKITNGKEGRALVQASVSEEPFVEIPRADPPAAMLNMRGELVGGTEHERLIKEDKVN